MYVINYNPDMDRFKEKIKSLIRKKQRLKAGTKGKFSNINP